MSILRQLDSQPVSFSLNFNSYYSYKSQLGGCISLIYIIIGVIILGLKTYDLYYNEHIYFTTKITKQDDLNSLNISNADFRLRIFKNDDESKYKNKNNQFIETQKLENQQLMGLKDAQPIKFEDLSLYGVKAFYNEHWSYLQNGKITPFDKQYQMIGCKNNSYDICLPSNISCILLGRSDFSKSRYFTGQIYRRCDLILRLCNPQQDPKCKKFSEPLSFFAFFHNNQIDPNKTKHSDTITSQQFLRVFQSDVQLNNQTQLELVLFFKRVIIQTDNSRAPQLFHKPQYQTTYTWVFDQQSTEEHYPIKVQNNLLRVLLKRSAFTHTYTRNFDRFDSMLGEVFGLLSLIGIVLFGLYKGYNNWSFQQFMKKQLKIKYIQPNILRYYSYLLKKIFACICCFSVQLRKWKQQENINKQKLQSKLNYLKILAYVDGIPKTIFQAENQNIHKKSISQKSSILTQQLLN